MRTITITLTDLAAERFAELRRLQEANGRRWHGDEFEAWCLLERGLREELDDARFIAEIYAERPDLRPGGGES